MSRITTKPMKSVPTAASATTVTTHATAWVSGAWVEFIASAAADLHIAGVFISKNSSITDSDIEIDIGIGAASAETVIHTIRTYIETTVNNQMHMLLLPVPLGGIAAGSRVAVRVRRHTNTATGYPICLAYYEDFDSTHASDAAMKAAPSAAAMVSLTPDAVAWADSAWVELTSGIANEIAVVGIEAPADLANVEVEYDLGTGSAAAETVITTFRTNVRATTPSGMFRNLWLPAPFPIAANTRIAVRMRKSGTSTTTHRAALLYIDNTTLL